jgi:type I restriction enzyme M protein
VELGTICKPEYGFTASAADNGDTRFVRITDIGPDGRLRKEDPKFIKLTSESEQYLLKKGDLLVARTGATFGKTMLFDEDYPAVFASYLIRLRFPPDRILPKFYWVFAQTERYWEQAHNLATGGGQPQFNGNALTQIKIPLPPLEVQKEIVAEIEGYQKVINGARAVLDNYRPHIPIHPDWPMVELGKACETIMDGTHFSPSNTETGDRLYITSKNVRENYLDLSNVSYISEVDHRAIYSRCPVRTGDVLYIKDGANTGLAAINTLTEEFSLLSSVAVMRGKPEMLSNRYLAFFLNSDQGRQSMLSMISGVAITRLTLTKLNAAMIPLPPLATQQAIVAEIEAEQALVAANRELIARFEKKIQATLARVWGEEA